VAAAAHEPREEAQVVTQKVLICYSGSDEADRAIDAAASLLGPQHAVVLTVAPTLTFAEGMAATSSVVPGGAFEDLNRVDSLRYAEAGAAHARRAGFASAEARASIASTTWRGIVDVADEIDAGAIVIGSRRLAGLQELARGSVSHDVATRAPRPVLIVPPAAP
jgi:nucleotide-binding universal stress UspA family protein